MNVNDNIHGEDSYLDTEAGITMLRINKKLLLKIIKKQLICVTAAHHNAAIPITKDIIDSYYILNVQSDIVGLRSNRYTTINDPSIGLSYTIFIASFL